MSPYAASKLKKYHQITCSGQVCKDISERDKLILEYAPLVNTIANRMGLRLPPQVSKDDLLSAGIMGLLDAIEKFDAKKGVEFKSYAEFRIRGAMLDELRSMDWVPRSVRRNAKRLQEAYAKVEGEKMRPAEDEEVARELGIDLDAFYKMLEEVRGVAIISKDELGHYLPHDAEDSAWPMNQFRAGQGPLDSLKLSEIRDVIAKAIEKLPKNEKTVVALYYYEELTMKEIGKIMGYTESRVSQLHTKAVMRLRVSLKSYFEE
ncbi:MAG: FliA/WhiG family RNA polymerase sigma factor [Deltaproteobacteria bacterium]|nr:FliA/WhiG family RNA polymerase sigma factor [Deltaproteobacteria bacterium]MBW2015428.1 FliA/WhiG family RNA polymerase sigma factor [Deltaproteobacteria bacterium]MBW2129182.1 FliA/WhiG family RNA polymerase sigma factor [Deltaproteobacteria bacterium]MBW2302796.1 FliA/WhiG family RNA polymerase sigma factor [Deltaproteobacteria bacterium]